MRFSSYCYTNPGGRSPNEDAVGAFANGDFNAWIAADGLGGHSYGEKASAEAVHVLEAELEKCTKIDEKFVSDTFKAMNEAVTALGGPLTTAACAFSDGKKLFYGNNGDSRFIFIRGKKILHHTNDHSLAYVAYRSGTITYEEIPTHPAQNRLYHSLGNEPDFSAELYESIDLKAGDGFILCTDGFWELVRDIEMIRTLNIADSPRQWMELLLDCLEPRLKANSDNYTAVCVMVEAD